MFPGHTVLIRVELEAPSKGSDLLEVTWRLRAKATEAASARQVAILIS